MILPILLLLLLAACGGASPAGGGDPNPFELDAGPIGWECTPTAANHTCGCSPKLDAGAGTCGDSYSCCIRRPGFCSCKDVSEAQCEIVLTPTAVRSDSCP